MHKIHTKPTHPLGLQRVRVIGTVTNVMCGVKCEGTSKRMVVQMDATVRAPSNKGA